MAITQTDVDRMEAALMSGMLEVERDGRRVRYNSTGDLMRAIAYAKSQIAASGNGSAAYSLATFGRD